jgi:hypothetical protein
MGVDKTMNADVAGALVNEHVVLMKFDGDPTQEEIDAGEATVVGKVVIDNGEIIEQWDKEE